MIFCYIYENLRNSFKKKISSGIFFGKFWKNSKLKQEKLWNQKRERKKFNLVNLIVMQFNLT